MMLDPRGVRFAALLTSIVLVVVLATSSGWLALAQAVVFLVTAGWPGRGPYGLIYRGLIAARLGPPTEWEPAAPVRFAQLIGATFALVAAGGYLSGALVLGTVMAAGALVAAFLNAAFGLCLGCHLYLAMRRLTHRSPPPGTPATFR